MFQAIEYRIVRQVISSRDINWMVNFRMIVKFVIDKLKGHKQAYTRNLVNASARGIYFIYQAISDLANQGLSNPMMEFS